MSQPALNGAPSDFDSLILEDVTRTFGRRRALTRVSLRCAAGEIVGLLGPNGAGKSTLLAIAATQLPPSSGTVRYGTQTAREIGPALRGRIGLLAHEIQLYPELTGRENLEFFAALYGLPAPPAAATAALGRAELGARGDEPLGRLSRGMRQRLALERCLLHGPRLVLLDEPFTGLDLQSARMLAERLRTLAREGRIVLVATHDLEIAQALVDRSAMLVDGRLTMLDGRGGLAEQYRLHLETSTPGARTRA